METAKQLHAEATATPKRPRKKKPFQSAHGKCGIGMKALDGIVADTLRSGKIAKGTESMFKPCLGDIAAIMNNCSLRSRGGERAFIGSIESAIRCITEICILYKAPDRILSAFLDAYNTIARIDKMIRAGTRLPVGPGMEARARVLNRDMNGFLSQEYLRTMRDEASSCMQDGHSTYSISFISCGQLDEIKKGSLEWKLGRTG